MAGDQAASRRLSTGLAGAARARQGQHRSQLGSGAATSAVAVRNCRVALFGRTAAARQARRLRKPVVFPHKPRPGSRRAAEPLRLGDVRPTKMARCRVLPQEQANRCGDAEVVTQAHPPGAAVNGHAATAAAARLRDAAAKAAQAAAWVVGATKEAAKAAEVLADATREALPLIKEYAIAADEVTNVIIGIAEALAGASKSGMDLTLHSQNSLVHAARLDDQCSQPSLDKGGPATAPSPSAATNSARYPEERRKRWATAVLGLHAKASAPLPGQGLTMKPNGMRRPLALHAGLRSRARQQCAAALLGMVHPSPPPPQATAVLQAGAEQASNSQPDGVEAVGVAPKARAEQVPGSHRGDIEAVGVAPKRHPMGFAKRFTGCKLAEWRSERSLAQAARTGRRTCDTDVTFVLDAWKFRKNDKRTNVIPDGQGFVKSEMLGLVRLRAYTKFVVASQSRKYPAVTKLLCKYLHDNPPAGLPPGSKFPFTTICINKDYAAKRHRDVNNLGLSVVRALGSFTGGRLRYWPDDPGCRKAPDVESLSSSDALVLDVRGRSVVVDSTRAHEVEPFVGRRYSLVYFTVPHHEKCTEAERRSLGELCGLQLPDEASEDIWQSITPAQS